MDKQPSVLAGVIRFALERKLIVFLLFLGLVGWGVVVAPFDYRLGPLPRDPVPVDAIPDIGENQQIVFTEWMGRSPQDVEDQITYPLTVALLGVPGVKTVRSYSFFGFSTIYIIFDEGIEFYWSRSRVLEKLSSLPRGTLPNDVQPALGPDATALGQVFWYTLEGRTPSGRPSGGWGLEELRSVQDWYVRYALLSAEGISEVGSIGGFVQEYQIDVDPDAMRAHGISLDGVFSATRMSNLDVGARTIEVNGAEYVIRGLGFIEGIGDIEEIVVGVDSNVPIRIRDIANVTKGPALRRGLLDKGGVETVGGVVVVRYGFNPLRAIEATKEKIAEISPGLPSKAVVDFALTSKKELADFASSKGFRAFSGDELNQMEWIRWLRSTAEADWPTGVMLSQVSIVPFYDRTGLIRETLGTLNDALREEIFITMIVVLVMVLHLRSSLLISALLPIAVVLTFIAMKLFGVPANIVALSGIAIAIGTMVDMGVIVTENILKRMEEAPRDEPQGQTIYHATTEVAGAVLTSVATTIVSFVPVFVMTGAEGKLFAPLAFTKTFALLGAVTVAMILIPAAAQLVLGKRALPRTVIIALLLGVIPAASYFVYMGFPLIALGFLGVITVYIGRKWIPRKVKRCGFPMLNLLAILVIGIFLTRSWMPLGYEDGLVLNVLFVFTLLGVLLGAFIVFQRFYPAILSWCLDHKRIFLLLPVLIVFWGATAWFGAGSVFGFLPETVRTSSLWRQVEHVFPGLGREFMPSLDEGSFLFMPTTMPHASLGEAHDALQILDERIAAIPEVESVVGKLGRADTALDPAPISMFETVVNYKSEYRRDEDGRILRFRFDFRNGEFVRDASGALIEDESGRPFRQWREHIQSPDDIWREITRLTNLPSTTAAPKLQPIAARLVMLQSGMRAPMGVKVKGPDLETLESVALEIEKLLKEVDEVTPETVTADRLIGKPYLEIDLDRPALARYGLHVATVQQFIEVAIGGKRITSTVEGRERYPVRVRYLRELRDSPERLGEILIPTPSGAQIPLRQLAEIRYVRGPQAIKSEDTFLTGYIVFDKQPNVAETDVVEAAQKHIEAKLKSGEFVLPNGVSYAFAGNYENQIRAQATLAVVLPVSLAVIFVILYLQFASVTTSLIVFSGVALAWSGGFLMLWAYGLSGFMDFAIFETNMRDLFNMNTVNLSVAIWVGFLALFGIATDNGVVTATYLDQSTKKSEATDIRELRKLVIAGAKRRIRPAMMTTATTLIALLPVLASDGRGADIMVPMAIPSFGGMVVAIISTLLVPVLYCAALERQRSAAHERESTWEREPTTPTILASQE